MSRHDLRNISGPATNVADDLVPPPPPSQVSDRPLHRPRISSRCRAANAGTEGDIAALRLDIEMEPLSADSSGSTFEVLVSSGEYLNSYIHFPRSYCNGCLLHNIHIGAISIETHEV